MLSTIKQFNWIDILVVIILFRIIYIAIKGGLAVELFKLLATLLAVYLSLHYYTLFSAFMSRFIGVENIFGKSLNTVSLIILAIISYLIFIPLRKIFFGVIKLEPVPGLNKWGGFILGITRAILVVSLIIYILVISPAAYLKHSVQDAYSGKRLFKVAPSVYGLLWNGIISKFIPNEKFNQNIQDVQENL